LTGVQAFLRQAVMAQRFVYFAETRLIDLIRAGNKEVVCCFGLVEFQTVMPKALLLSLSVYYRHLGW
jgi:hypothetical protein